MKVTVGKTRLPEKELENLTSIEVKRRVAELEGAPPVPLTEGEVAVSAAARRWARLEALDKPEYIPFECDGDNVFIKRLSAKEVRRLALSFARDVDGLLKEAVSDSEDDAMLMLILQRTICEDDQGLPYFQWPDLSRYMDSPDQAAFVLELFQQTVSVNPDIFQTLDKDSADRLKKK